MSTNKHQNKERDTEATGTAGRRKEQGNFEELYMLLESFDSVMLTTATASGALRSRPMALQVPEGDVTGCDLWFVTAAEAPKVDEVEHEHHVAVSALRTRDKAWISISAIASVSRDPSEVERAWRPEFEAWFPKGTTAADVAIMKLRITQAEYWEPEGGIARVLFDEVKALVKGQSAADLLNPPKVVKKVA